MGKLFPSLENVKKLKVLSFPMGTRITRIQCSICIPDQEIGNERAKFLSSRATVGGLPWKKCRSAKRSR
jgi:hypothetical protein